MSRQYLYIRIEDDAGEPRREVGLSYDPPLPSDLMKIEFGELLVVEINDDFADGESEIQIVADTHERVKPDAVVIDQFADLDPFHVITKNPEAYES